MKRLILPALFLLSSQLFAVQRAENYAQAHPLVKDDGYVLFAYAEDWDTFSKKLCESLMNDPDIQKAAGDAVFMPLPIPNVTTDEKKKAMEERYGELKMPAESAPRSYPAILLFNKNGRHSSTIWGPFMAKPDPKEIAKMMKQRIADIKKQTVILEKAEKAQGVEKARLLGQASDFKDLVMPEFWPDRLINALKKLDPNDETGYQRKLRPPMAFVAEALKVEQSGDWKAAIKLAESWLNDPIYTTYQKQTFHAIIIGMIHRHGNIKDGKEIRRHALAMKALDPESMLGKSADLAVREWVISFSLAEGWTPAVLQDDSEPIELTGALPVKEPGTYKVTFTFTNGRHAANISSVTLYDGDAKIAEDAHVGRAGIPNTNNVYTLKVPKELTNPRIFVKFDQKRDRDPNGYCDSYGQVTITR